MNGGGGRSGRGSNDCASFASNFDDLDSEPFDCSFGSVKTW